MSYRMDRAPNNPEWVIGDNCEVEYAPEPAAPKVFRAPTAPKAKPAWTPKAKLRATSGKFSERVIVTVADALFISPHAIKGKARRPDCVDARALVTQILRRKDYLRYTTPFIGKILGGRDHSTIVNLNQNWDVYCKRSPHLVDAMEAVLEILGPDADPTPKEDS